jgi:hypothetical protein
MTLLDAPKYDEAREKRHQVLLYSGAGLLLVVFIGWWLVAGRPVDWPWTWNNHLHGRAAVNSFLTAVEQNDLPRAYGVWTHDQNWQQHPNQNGAYPFARFQQDWSSSSPDNEYGAIQSHRVAASRTYGNSLLVAAFINGRKSKALNLVYDPKTHTLDFAPPGVEFMEGPGGIS